MRSLTIKHVVAKKDYRLRCYIIQYEAEFFDSQAMLHTDIRFEYTHEVEHIEEGNWWAPYHFNKMRGATGAENVACAPNCNFIVEEVDRPYQVKPTAIHVAPSVFSGVMRTSSSSSSFAPGAFISVDIGTTDGTT